MNSAHIGIVAVSSQEKSFSVDALRGYLHAVYDIDADIKQSDEIIHLCFADTNVVLTLMPETFSFPEDVFSVTYNWKTAKDELQSHQTYYMVSVQQKDPLERLMISSKITNAVLNLTDAIGVYQPLQMLLNSSNEFKEMVALHLEDPEIYPLNTWIRIGLYLTENGISAYTHGLYLFGKKEIEILNSQNSIEELYGMMYNISHYVVERDVTLKHGETIGLSLDQRLPILVTQGALIDGEIVRILY